MRKETGFTLIEILVSVAIISLLSMVGVVSYRSVILKGRDTRRMSDLEEIRAALESYRVNNNAYPPSITWGEPLSDATITYMSAIPQDPKDTQSYYYNRPTLQDYTLGAKLETGDGTDGTVHCSGDNSLHCNYCLSPLQEKQCP